MSDEKDMSNDYGSYRQYKNVYLQATRSIQLTDDSIT